MTVTTATSYKQTRRRAPDEGVSRALDRRAEGRHWAGSRGWTRASPESRGRREQTPGVLRGEELALAAPGAQGKALAKCNPATLPMALG